MKMSKYVSCALVLASLVASGAEAWACECEKQGDDELMTRADVAFHGRVTEAEDGEGSVDVTLSVKQGYKGAKVGESITVSTSDDTKACGVDFYVGRSYMVYASKDGRKLVTSQCDGTAKRSKGFVAPGVDSITPVLPGPGDPGKRASRASAVFVADVVSVGKGFSVSHEGVPIEVKVVSPIKGAVKKGKKLELRVDELSCGKKKLALSQLDLDEPEPPAEVGHRYLFYTHSEDPYLVATCHDSMVHEEDADEQIAALRGLCGGKGCPKLSKGFDAPHTLRKKAKDQLVSGVESAIKQCAKDVPMFGKGGDFNELAIDIRVTSATEIEVAKANARGSITESEPYNRGVECIIDKAQKWKLDAFAGGRVLFAIRLQMTGKGKRPKFLGAKVTVVDE